MEFEDLTAEQQTKLKTFKTPEEILEFAHEEGVELSDEQLEAVNGGISWTSCPDNLEHCPLACDVRTK